MDKDFFEELFNNLGKEQRNHWEISKNNKKKNQKIDCTYERGGGLKSASAITGSPESQQPTGSQIIRICMESYLKIDKWLRCTKTAIKVYTPHESTR